MLALLAAGALFAWAAHSGVREMATPLHPLREPDAAMPIPLEQVPEKLDFQRDVMPIFATSCIDCHGPKRQRAGLRVDRRDDFYAPGDKKPLIVPGHADASRLIDIVSGQVNDMKSAEAHLLPPRDISLIKSWINAGARWP